MIPTLKSCFFRLPFSEKEKQYTKNERARDRTVNLLIRTLFYVSNEHYSR